MAKKLNFVNDVQSNDTTANKAVEASVPTWANKTKVGGRSHDEMLRLELELECAKRTMRAVNAERRKADRREAEQRHDYITAIVAMAGKYSDAIETLASMGIAYAQVQPSGVGVDHNKALRDEATCNANCDRTTLHIVEEKTVQDASIREAKKTATAKTTAKKTAKKDTTTATTAKRSTASKGTSKGAKKYTPKAKQGVKYEDEYTITAKNGVVYRVGHFHHTKTDEELWAVSAVEYSDEAKAWLKDTFSVYWSAYAGGFIFSYKPDTYLRRGVAKKGTTAKKTAKKNA